MKKTDFPVSEIRRFLEPGPIVLVSSRLNDKINIMTMGWHTVMEFTPSLIGCIISNINYSHEMIRKSRECVINIPTADMIDKIISIGTSSGSEVDKFKEFGLTPIQGEKVKAPLIDECYASFECRIADDALVEKYNFFIFEVLKAHKASTPRFPVTVHYRGDGIFMISGKHIAFPERLKGM
jgi:flavin reductase (DIM6/NTAB) family NADH-FMN oxidoreductase RutF